MKILYQGIPGAYSHLAALEVLSTGANVDHAANEALLITIDDAFKFISFSYLSRVIFLIKIFMKV